MFLQNAWYVAAWPSELDNEAVVARRILDRPVVMFRDAAGTPVAMLDRCPHRLVPLSAGEREGDAIRCGYHGMLFAKDGQCIHIPGQDAIPSNARATLFPSVIQHGLVWIWMGDPKLADVDLVPYIPWPGLDHWVAARGYTHVVANYQLLSDNLLDLSHENFIHKGTIGNDDEESIADFPVKVTMTGGTVSAHRDMPNIAPPPFFRLMLGSDERIYRWQTAIWTAPSLNMTDVGARPINGTIDDTIVTRVLHLLTPETERSTHYFWSHNRNFRRDDEALTTNIGQALVRTFDEDKHMLELQQRELEESGLHVPQMALKVDDAPMRARRTLSALIRQEKEGISGLLNRRQPLIPDPEALEPIAV